MTIARLRLPSVRSRRDPLNASPIVAKMPERADCNGSTASCISGARVIARCFPGIRLIRKRQPGASGTYVDMGSGSLVRHGRAEREVRNALHSQIPHQPCAFRLIRADRHIHAAAMIEAERAMQRRFAIRADRQRPGEPCRCKRLRRVCRSAWLEDPVAVVFRVDFAGPFGMRLRLASPDWRWLFPYAPIRPFAGPVSHASAPDPVRSGRGRDRCRWLPLRIAKSRRRITSCCISSKARCRRKTMRCATKTIWSACSGSRSLLYKFFFRIDISSAS